MASRKGRGRRRGTPKRRPLRRSISIFGIIVPIVGQFALLAVLPSCLTLPPMRNSLTIEDRVESFAAGDGHNLYGPVTIRFDEFQHAFIEASDERDVPYAMGLVHAHLRLGQMEIFRRAAWGRLAEIAGPVASQVDQALHAFDIPRAVPQMLESLPPQTREWLDRYTEGVNAHLERTGEAPFELRFFGVQTMEPWTSADVLAVGRVISIDVNWIRLLPQMGLLKEAEFADYAERTRVWDDLGTPSFSPGDGSGSVSLDALLGMSRSGSNCWAVSGARSASGSAMLASDPHVGMNLPPLWCMVGYRSPAGAAMGYTVAGVPLVLIGRNERIAWSGTNMLSISTTFYDISDLEPDRFTVDRRPIRVRWWFNTESRIRQTDLGPVITDAPLLRRLGLPPIAMKWRGHDPSDELTAFLRVSKAQTFEQFRAAFETYAVSGQNFLYADADGNIGQVMAVAVDPAAGRVIQDGLIGDPQNPRHIWNGQIGSFDMPFAYNPETGVLISANNTPVRTDPAITLGGNSNDRFDRLADLLQRSAALDLDDMAELQLDVYSLASHQAAMAAMRSIESGHLEAWNLPISRAIRNWDGHYRVGSDGAVAYQRFAALLASGVYPGVYGDRIASSMLRSGSIHDFIREDIERGAINPDVIAGALQEAQRGYSPTTTWGDIHRFRIAHPLSNSPIFGREFVYGDRPVSGTGTTVLKSAHSLTGEEHFVTFGANARFLCEPGDIDANRFVLLGGNDGRLGSRNFADQVDTFLEGRSIVVPMSVDGVRRHFSRAVELKPGPKRGDR